jgi:hypothetical protein
MATKDALDAHKSASKNAPFQDGINHILRASGRIAAFICTKQRRQKDFIKSNGKDDERF